jgi:protein-S-isoprenylcysteine O-methyltransferase Ste14
MPALPRTHIRVLGVRLTLSAARVYFAVQAASGAVWWILVASVPQVRDLTLGGLPALPIAVADLPLFIGASVLVACGMRWAAWIVSSWTGFVAAVLSVYATATMQAGWGALVMIAATIGSAVAGSVIVRGAFPAHWLLRGPLALREARGVGRMRNLTTTALQIVVFWGLFLGVIPLVLSWFEQRWGVGVPFPVLIRGIGLVELIAASALGLWSGATMASLGDGTPLPSATARKLVIAGPYRYVRNPMAVAGIAQGVAVGLLLGSWLVVIWALCGSLVWNSLIRPFEEEDLEKRFGDDFRAYRDHVKCWVPGRAWHG